MSIQPSYPGVYIEEIPSGVRTITGVSTSVAAFVGWTHRGPVNTALHVLSYSDFERKFGGLSADSEVAYAVRQFFVNGGSDAWVVRLAKNAGAAFKVLQSNAAADVLKITALDEGFSGNSIEARVDYLAANPASVFNLTLNYISPGRADENRTELFQNLSMNSRSARYAPEVINGASQLVRVERVASADVLSGLASGTSISGELTQEGVLIDVARLKDAAHDQFQVSVDGSSPVTVQIVDADVAGADSQKRLEALCAAIAAKLNALSSSNPLLKGVTCTREGNRIRIASGSAGEASSVQVLPGIRNDLSARLRLGTINGGTEADGAAALRPAEAPGRATLTSGVLDQTAVPDSKTAGAIPNATHNTLIISIDGDQPKEINLGSAAAAGSDLASRLQEIAGRIQAAVNQYSKAGYRGFTAQVNGSRLVLSSGTRGAGSSVVVNAGGTNDIAASLKLLDNPPALPQNVILQGGSESQYADDDAYRLFIADRSLRKGIYALEAVDLFNILCLPGVSDPGILQDADAYCTERRAILLIDVPKTTTTPGQMAQLAAGSSLPKSRNAAVYYPWIRIADPLKGGKLRAVAPSGTIAGLFARTDSTRGVWKAPAGTEATLVGAQGVVYTLTDGENGTLNPLGVNCIRSLPVFGTVAWGARTMRGADQMADEWKYIPVRRTALYIEESLYRGTRWVIFEPNDEPLWAQIRLNIGAFMHSLFRQGAFQGMTPKDAYFVKCDGETTTQDDINRGIVNIMVGFAPLKPAEFVIIRLQQIAGQIQA